MASRRPETIAKREREQARREKRERKQAKKEARALGVPQVTAETADGETRRTVLSTTRPAASQPTEHAASSHGSSSRQPRVATVAPSSASAVWRSTSGCRVNSSLTAVRSAPVPRPWIDPNLAQAGESGVVDEAPHLLPCVLARKTANVQLIRHVAPGGRAHLDRGPPVFRRPFAGGAQPGERDAHALARRADHLGVVTADGRDGAPHAHIRRLDRVALREWLRPEGAGRSGRAATAPRGWRAPSPNRADDPVRARACHGGPSAGRRVAPATRPALRRAHAPSRRSPPAERGRATPEPFAVPFELGLSCPRTTESILELLAHGRRLRARLPPPRPAARRCAGAPAPPAFVHRRRLHGRARAAPRCAGHARCRDGRVRRGRAARRCRGRTRCAVDRLVTRARPFLQLREMGRRDGQSRLAHQSCQQACASAEPSSGSVPAASSSSSTRDRSPAESRIETSVLRWAENVDRLISIDCRSPMSASTWSKTGSTAASAGGRSPD